MHVLSFSEESFSLLTLGTGATAEIKLHLLVIFYFVRLFTFNLAYAMKLYVP